MAIHTSIDPRVLQQIGDDIRQLAEPIHVAIRRRIITHPALLDQLRIAILPASSAAATNRRPVPASRPAANLNASDALATIYVELAGWHTRHHLPSPPHHTDWQKAAMRQLVGLAPNLAGDITTWLATDIHEWWRLAATHTGWTVSDLQKLR